MAGTIIADKIQTENAFLTLNVGQTLVATINSSGILNSSGGTMIGANGAVSNTAITGNIISSQIAPSVTLTTPIISGNLNLDSAGTTGIRVPSANTISFHTAGTEDVRIDANGDVGIGTSSPSSYGPNGSRLAVVNTTSGQPCNMSIVNNSTDLYEGGGLLLGNSALTTNYDATFLYHHKFDATGNDYGAFNISQRKVDGTYVSNIWNVDYKNNVTTWYRPNTSALQMQLDASNNLLFNSGYGSAAVAYGCRAWVNFNGTGTPAIRASGNVSSITDSGVGLYTVNFTNAMPDINYSAVGGAGQSSGDYSRYVGFNGLQTASGVQIRIAYPVSDGVTDSQLIMVSVFR